MIHLRWVEEYADFTSIFFRGRRGAYRLVVISDYKTAKQLFSLPQLADRPNYMKIFDLHSKYMGGE